jgi:hypothetical protein
MLNWILSFILTILIIQLLIPDRIERMESISRFRKSVLNSKGYWIIDKSNNNYYGNHRQYGLAFLEVGKSLPNSRLPHVFDDLFLVILPAAPSRSIPEGGAAENGGLSKI